MKNVLLAISLIALISLTSCNTEVSIAHDKKNDAQYLISSPMVKDTTIIKEYVAQVRAIRHIELRALEGGYLQHIFVDEGQHITKGQKMFQILPSLYNAELQKAKAELNFANIEYKNTKLLADKNVVSENELALVEAKLKKAQAEVLLAETHLGFTDIRAPFDGIMDRFNAREGSLMEEGDLLTTLSDNSEMWVYFNVPEAEYLNYKMNDKDHQDMIVELLMANNKIFDQKGVVKTIEADFNNETGNIAFRATFPNPEGLLRHGETGNIQIELPFKKALLIPQKATFEILDKKFVYVVDKNNVIHSKEIKIKEELPHLYIVESGLKADDKILIEGLRKVFNNEKINISYEKPAVVFSGLQAPVN